VQSASDHRSQNNDRRDTRSQTDSVQSKAGANGKTSRQKITRRLAAAVRGWHVPEGATLKIRFGTDEVRYGCQPATPGSRAKKRWTVIEKPKRYLLIGFDLWPGSVPQRREFIHGQTHWIPRHDRAEKLTANRPQLC
jgi:hypothetical protein